MDEATAASSMPERVWQLWLMERGGNNQASGRAAEPCGPAWRRRSGPLHQMLHEVLEDGRVDLVMDLLAAPFGDDEAGVAEDREVARDGRPARVEARRDVAGGARGAVNRYNPRDARGRARGGGDRDALRRVAVDGERSDAGRAAGARRSDRARRR